MLKAEGLNLIRTNTFYKNETFKGFVVNSLLSPIKNLSEKANTEYFLKDINLEIKAGERIALLGKNGSGKSTLCKILSSRLFASSGKLENSFDVSLFSQLEQSFYRELSGKENLKYFLQFIYENSDKNELSDLFNFTIEFSGLGSALDRQVETYSTGMVNRLALSLALAKNHDLLILDEMQAHADQQFRDKVKNKIKHVINASNSVIVVSHDNEDLVGVCERGIIIDKGQIVFDGTFVKALAAYSLMNSGPT